MELTQREKDILTNLISSLQFKIGETAIAQEFEEILRKIKSSNGKSVELLDKQ